MGNGGQSHSSSLMPPKGGRNQQTGAPGIVRRQRWLTVIDGALHSGRLWTSTDARFGVVGPSARPTKTPSQGQPWRRLGGY